jgi:hypothetical protein
MILRFSLFRGVGLWGGVGNNSSSEIVSLPDLRVKIPREVSNVNIDIVYLRVEGSILGPNPKK